MTTTATPSTSLPIDGAGKRLYIKTWGCQMNEYDSAKMADVLGVSHGFLPVDEPTEADVILL
ncbi:MAG TPA: tRNA (N6-isopentenyl adenosine(37)-C2)-methylthiotransferase MiaB, partial [Guyparkeria sp.]|nr:tRNA (N6-isopentenyl adenosine(37)-C2)-methylthiotransferase MiaB [Guyparkeria sp.]